jgi:uncharacterized protein (TIRG00374 family)
LVVAVALVLAAAVFLYLRLRETGFAWSRFTEVLRGLDPFWMSLALFLILSAYVIRAIRWRVMIRPLAPNATIWQITAATFIGFTAVVLFGRAGEPVRPYLIARKQGLPFSSQVAAWLVERILDLLMVFAIFGLALTQSQSTSGSRLHTALQAGGWVAGLSAAGCLAALAALHRYRGQIRTRLDQALGFLPEGPLNRVRCMIDSFDEGLRSTRDPASLWALVIFTVVEWIVLAAVFVCVMRASPAVNHLAVSQVLVTMGFVTFAGIVQIPGIGGGMQLATVLVLTELYGVGVEAASGMALVLWAVNFLTALPVGLACGFHEGIRWRTMRHIGEETP